jgi:hypothetical protein
MFEVSLRAGRQLFETICEVRYVVLQDKNGLFTFLTAAGGFVCGNVFVTAAMLRDLMQDTPFSNLQFGFSPAERRVKYQKYVPLAEVRLPTEERTSPFQNLHTANGAHPAFCSMMPWAVLRGEETRARR